jgi:hypothetical protein
VAAQLHTKPDLRPFSLQNANWPGTGSIEKERQNKAINGWEQLLFLPHNVIIEREKFRLPASAETVASALPFKRKEF